MEVVGTGLSTTTDELGVFVITNVPAGIQTLRTSAPGFISRDISLLIVPGLNAGVTIFLSPDLGESAANASGTGPLW